MPAAGSSAGLPFPPDPFQLEAIDSLDAGRSVLVSAPTGSGKTLVAAYAVHRALAAGGKAFYTTPLKALSNQKFAELVGRPRRRPGGPAHRGHRRPARGPGRGDDHRGAAQHAAGRLRPAGRPAHGGPRRGPLPPGPLPGRGVGGGARPHARPRWPSSACRPRWPTPPSWGTGCARCGARPTWWSSGAARSCCATTSPSTAARGRPPGPSSSRCWTDGRRRRRGAAHRPGGAAGRPRPAGRRAGAAGAAGPPARPSAPRGAPS